MDRYCTKAWLTDEPEPSTSSVCCFSGPIKWKAEQVSANIVEFVEVANCHEKARLHRTMEMSHKEWIAQVQRLRDELAAYQDWLELQPEIPCDG